MYRIWQYCRNVGRGRGLAALTHLSPPETLFQKQDPKEEAPAGRGKRTLEKAMTTEAISIPQKKDKAGAFSTGMALFSMFFGAGNLIFPLIIGRMSGHETPYAIVGLGISAVAFPLLGLLAMMFFAGDIHSFLNRLGRIPALLLLFLLQMSMGPLGCLPRLITLMHASIKSYFPGFSLGLFSIFACAAIFLLTYRPQKIVKLLGVVLTPLFLVIMGILIAVGMINAPDTQPVSLSSAHYFGQGLKLGYQTMDLICALLFATIVLPHLTQGTEHLPKEEAKRITYRRMASASLIAALLLMVSYIGLCWISAHHSWTLPADLLPEELLQGIAVRVLGTTGGMIAAATTLLACLTTAMSLAVVFANYLHKDVFKEKRSHSFSLALTLGATAAMATLGFSGIVKLWGPILDVLYPSLIVLCLFNIAHSVYRVERVKAPVFLTLAIAFAALCYTKMG